MNANMGIRRQGAGLGCSRWFSETGAILYEVKLGEDLIHQVALERARAMAEQRNAFRSSSSRMVRDSQNQCRLSFFCVCRLPESAQNPASGRSPVRRRHACLSR